MDSPTVFTCAHCGHLSNHAKAHELHFTSHRHLSRKIICGFGKCSSVLPNGPAFRSHVTRAHRRLVSILQHPSLASLPMTENSQFKCPVKFCSERFFYVRLLNSHLREHFRKGISCPCLVPECAREFSSMNSLTGHISKCHKKTSPAFRVVDTAVDHSSAHSTECNESPDVVESEDLDPSAEDIGLQMQPSESLTNVAQFFQKLAYKFLVPLSTVQVIAEELKTLMCNSQQILLDNLNVCLKNSKVSSEVINEAFESAKQKNNLPMIFHELRTDHIRKKTYKSMFAFVEPQRVGLANGKFFYYVPIGETLQACFSNRAWLKYLINVPQSSQDDVLRDFIDGEAFKNNKFFLDNPNAIKIILYQDGVELVNPLGLAKNLNHNIIAVYMALGNLPSELRFTKDYIQLVALCIKEDFDHKLVYGKIVDDILKLQNVGCDIPSVGNMKVGLVCIAGDNLGSHGLGGFLENFSKALYFCRYCLLHRHVFVRHWGEVRHFEHRTVESYADCLSELRQSNKKSYKGVKLDSEFNRVQGYHVCDNGLPPCIGHELCEGVIAHDLKLFIQYFVSNGMFSLETLSDAIDKFPYSIEDRQDKPVKIKKLEKKKLAGSAWQLRTFLRLFPLMMSSYVEHSDKVWQCVLKLGQITDIVIAPEIHVSQLPMLQSLKEEYLVMRLELFPDVKLRPKHHFLFHYSFLFLAHGILMKVWTMRFESKHCFFKTAWRCSRNSKNILKMLSFKHEFLQSYVRSGGSARYEIETGTRYKFSPTVYSAAILNAISSVGHFSSFEHCSNVSIKGTPYRKGHVVLLKQSAFSDVLEIGTIFMILIDVNDSLKFVVQKGTAEMCPLTRAYKVNRGNGFLCVGPEDLVSYYPLTPYVIDTAKYLVLKHSIVNFKV